MDNAEYWRKRAIEREEQWHNKSQETIEKELALQYEATLHHLNKEIESLYAKFAKDNAISMHKARELIQGSEHRVWRMDIEEYIKAIDKTGDKGLLRELNTLAMRSRISRLDKLYGETLMELDKLGRYTSERTRQFLYDAYEKNRTDTAKDYLIKGEGPVNVKVDPKRIEDVLRHPWSGKVYSQRIWRGMDRLSKAIKEEIVNGVHRGDSIDKMTKRIQECMDVSRRDAVRLVRTEMSYVNNQAALDSIKGAKMKYYRFIATIDKRTSTACKDHNDHVYAIEDAQIGTNVPPLHPHCRSTIAGTLRGPAIDGKEATKVAQTKVIEVEDANTTKLEPPKPPQSSKLPSNSKANRAKEQPTAKIIIHNDPILAKLKETNLLGPREIYQRNIVDIFEKLPKALKEPEYLALPEQEFYKEIVIPEEFLPLTEETMIEAMRKNYICPTTEFIKELAKDSKQAYTINEYKVGKARYFDDSGNAIWPGNLGGIGAFEQVELEKEFVLDRIGNDFGSYTSVPEVDFINRAMPESNLDRPYSIFEVVIPIKVKSAPISPWFGYDGKGIQYIMPLKVNELLEKGVIKRVEYYDNYRNHKKIGGK